MEVALVEILFAACNGNIVLTDDNPWKFTTAGRWKKMESHDSWASVVVPAFYVDTTYDYSILTNLVFAAHDFCCRISIEFVSKLNVKITVSRRTRSGGISERHPTLAEAIEFFRDDHKPSRFDNIFVIDDLAEDERKKQIDKGYDAEHDLKNHGLDVMKIIPAYLVDEIGTFDPPAPWVENLKRKHWENPLRLLTISAAFEIALVDCKNYGKYKNV